MELPKYLGLLLERTPLAVERIRQAWPGLSTTDRAELLSMLLADPYKDPRALRWSDHRNQLIDLALDDDNAYIRYLAARHVTAPFKIKDADETSGYLDDQTRFAKVKSDPVSLVRSAAEEQGWKALTRELDAPESFWKRPQTERLALVNGAKEEGKKIAELLRYATKDLLPVEGVTVVQMRDVLLQYLGEQQTIAEPVADSKDHALRSSDGWAEYGAGESVKALWESIPHIPTALAFVLIEYLPEKAGLWSGISSQVIDSLDEFLLGRLLMRDDITLKELRRKLYRESKNDSLRGAAVVSQQFELLDSDISELVYNPGESEESIQKKVNELATLAYCRGTTLVQIQAINHLITNAPMEFREEFHGKGGAVWWGEFRQTERANRLPPYRLQEEVIAMRLFSIATSVAPINVRDTGGRLPEKLMQHRSLVVQNNPWQTYLNLSKVVRLDYWKQTVGHIPKVCIRGFSLPDELNENPEDHTSQDSRQVFDLLKNVQSRVSDVPEKDRAELSAFSDALSRLSTQMHGVESVVGRRVDTLHARVEKLAIYLLFTIIGAVLILLLLGNCRGQ